MQILIEKLVLLSICCTPLHGSIAAKKGRFAAAKKSCNIIRREQCVQDRAGGGRRARRTPSDPGAAPCLEYLESMWGRS
jgi:hypothetical protein